MNSNVSKHTTATEQPANGLFRHSDEAPHTEPSVQESRQGLYAKVEQRLLEVECMLLLEVEHSRDQALRRTPQSTKHVGDDVEDDQRDDSTNTNDLADRSRVLSQRPLRLILALIVAASLCGGGLRFWNYLQSYESTDDAQIDGHLDPLSTRIDGTVARVYVEDTYHVKEGQALVDLDPRDYQVAVENTAANLAQAEQGVKAAQQNYELSVANLDAAIATK